MKPKITVVIPIYGTEKYLRKCLDSVVNQSFKDIEIICVDDCSPDLSFKIVEEYCTQDKRIRLIRQKQNTGQGGARNTAIRKAKADFIASVDSDDAMKPTMLEDLWNACENGKFDIVCCGYSKVDNEGQVFFEKKLKDEVFDNNNNQVNIFKLLNPAIWNKLWKKSLFVENEIFFPNKLYYQDMATIPLLIASANKIKVINKSLYNYVSREGSVTNSFSSKHIIDYLKVYEILYQHLKKRDLLEHYAGDLASHFNEDMNFHATNVIESIMPELEKQQYLRHLLMMKWSFFECHDVLTSKSEEELLALLTHSVSFKDITSEKPFIFGVVAPISKRPNLIQSCMASVFGFVFQKLMSERQMKKLETRPFAFFKDSKNQFTRMVGKLFRFK